MQQLPEDLRDIVMPDEGTAWVGWDWSAIETWLLMGYARSKYLHRILTQGLDIHLLTTCDIFGLPYPPDQRDRMAPANQAWREEVKWAVNGEVKRTFSKSFRYAYTYGRDPKNAGNAPGAKMLGLKTADLVQAAERMMAADPDYKAWRAKVAEEAVFTRQSRTFMGRLRRLYGDPSSIVREAFNHPLQGGVSDIKNLTVLAITGAVPYAKLALEMHDALTWQVPLDKVDEFRACLPQWAEREWDVCGQLVKVPAKYKVRYC